jgi:proteic killer suppression protein
MPVSAQARMTMDAPTLVDDMNSLPPAARQQAADFVAFLKARSGEVRPAAKAKRTALADEPFVGMWRDRPDMEDSAGWVRDLREPGVPPGNRLERLRGDRDGQHSIRVGDQFRVCFRWETGHANDVEITDYH